MLLSELDYSGHLFSASACKANKQVSKRSPSRRAALFAHIITWLMANERPARNSLARS